MRAKIVAAVLAATAAGVAGGVALDRLAPDRLAPDHPAQPGTAADAASGKRVLYWWDPMMPAFKSPTPGKSPMGMDMVPVYEGEEAGGTVAVSPAMMQTLGVRTAVAERAALVPVVRTFGTVGFDEGRTAHVHVRAEGWVERLHHRVEGETVARGDVLFEFFSPNLASAAFEFVRELDRGSAEGARRKLLALGVDERQVEEIRRGRQVPDRIKVYAPQSGVVVTHAVAEGMFVEPDMTLMSITDPSAVWVLAELFETQASLVRPGMAAEVSVKGVPERAWSGAVDYVYPDLRPETRTVRVRIRLDNRDGALRPNMYAAVRLAAAPLPEATVVPAGAVIRTGRGERVVTVVGEGRFRPVPVRTGPAVGDRVAVVEGLEAGTRVVTSAHFLIDSEASLGGALDRMDAGGGAEGPGQAPVWTEATVDGARAGTVTLSHAPIPEIGWPAMTMDFAVDLAVPASGLAPGARVRVRLERGGDGGYRVVDARPAEGPR